MTKKKKKLKQNDLVDYLVDNIDLLPPAAAKMNCAEFETKDTKIILKTDNRPGSLKIVDAVKELMESGKLGEKGKYEGEIW